VEAIELCRRDAGNGHAIHRHALQAADVERWRGEGGAIDGDAPLADHPLDIAAGTNAGAGQCLGDALRGDLGLAYRRWRALDAGRLWPRRLAAAAGGAIAARRLWALGVAC
jgi:hypothetical protein